MKLYPAILVFTLLFLISGCAEKIVYVKTPCPKLQTWDVNASDLNLTYEVYYENGKN